MKLNLAIIRIAIRRIYGESDEEGKGRDMEIPIISSFAGRSTMGGGWG